MSKPKDKMYRKVCIVDKSSTILNKDDLIQIKKNFDAGFIKIGIPVTIECGTENIGWVKELEIKEDGSLWGNMQLTTTGKEIVDNKIYKKLIISLRQEYKDIENPGVVFGNVLIEISLTNAKIMKEVTIVE